MKQEQAICKKKQGNENETELLDIKYMKKKLRDKRYRWKYMKIRDQPDLLNDRNSRKRG